MEKHELRVGARIRWVRGVHPDTECKIVKVRSRHVELLPLGSPSKAVRHKGTFRRPTQAVLQHCELIKEGRG